jgi:site-specific recombinase XerD
MGEMTLREALNEYQNVYMPSRNFAERTRVEYSNDLLDLILFLEKNGLKKVGDIELPDIERYLAELDKRGIAGTTRKRKIVSVRSFLQFLYQDGQISNNISNRIIPPLVDTKNPRYLTQREYTRLVEACAENPRDFAIIQLLDSLPFRCC